MNGTCGRAGHPIHIIIHFTVGGFWDYSGTRLNACFSVSTCRVNKTLPIHRRERPFVRIGDERIGTVASIKYKAHLRHNCVIRRMQHLREAKDFLFDKYPQLQVPDRAGGGSCSNSCDHGERKPAVFPVFSDGGGECLCIHSNSASDEIFRTPSCPTPSTMAAFSIEECVCSEQYKRSRGRSARPDILAHAPACELLHVRRERNKCGNRCCIDNDTEKFRRRPSICRNQSSTTSSSSVAEGDVRQSIPLTLSAVASISAKFPSWSAVGKVCKESGMIPVRDAGKYECDESPQVLIPCSRWYRRRCGQLFFYIPRFFCENTGYFSASFR